MSALPWLAALGPLALYAAAFAPGDARRASLYARAAAGLALALAALALALALRHGRLETGTLGLGGIGFALWIDTLSATMATLVGFIGLVVIAYSRNYLDGHPRQAVFLRGLCATLASVLLLILSGNLLQLWLAWIATSAALHGLLLFYPERPGAQFAARKKWLVSRLGDAALFAALPLAYANAGSLAYGPVLAHGGAGVAVLIALAALIKSAQFPWHGWLVEVMETPTPVSALLHAGVINAGGIVVLRFSPLIAASETATLLLFAVGALTALFGSVSMLPQTSVKVSLAYSTVAQMGFMMLECGLGAYGAAALHIVAHSLYKAHAFLSSGSVIDIARAAWTPRLTAKPHPARLALAIWVALSLVGAGAYVSGETHSAGVLVLAAVLALGMVPMLANAFDAEPDAAVIARSLAAALTVVAAYFGAQRGSAALFAASLAPPPESLPIPALLGLLAAFAALIALQALLPRLAHSPFWRALHIHALNGFYLNTFANRLILKFWPARTPALGG